MDFNGLGPILALSIRILVVDDHLVVRQSLAGFFKLSPGMVVIGEAGDGIQAIRIAKELRPDVVLMDYSMPGMNGADATRAIRSFLPKVIVIGLSMNDTASVRQDMLNAGAFQMLSKDTSPKQVLDSICQAVKQRNAFQVTR